MFLEMIMKSNPFVNVKRSISFIFTFISVVISHYIEDLTNTAFVCSFIITVKTGIMLTRNGNLTLEHGFV